MSPVDPARRPLAAIFGLSGYVLTDAEKDFIARANPLGYILFGRNILDPGQVKSLTASLQAMHGGRTVPILIDQEGGRVARLREPHWQAFPATKTFGDMADETGAQQNAANRAKMIRAEGFNVNCAPVLDVLFPDTDKAIGDRAFSSQATVVGRMAAADCRGSLQEKIIPVVKHFGHGRATQDSHLHLPVVTAARTELDAVDFAPYRYILQQDFIRAVWGMPGHIVFTAIDPDRPASCSPVFIGDVVRRDLGFDGLLLSDDLDMGALDKFGHKGQRAKMTLAAGCDIALQCNGVLADMEQVAAAIGKMSDDGVRRFNDSIAFLAN